MPSKIKPHLNQVLERAYGSQGDYGLLFPSIFYTPNTEEKVLFVHGEFKEYVSIKYPPIIHKEWELEDGRIIIYQDFQFKVVDCNGQELWKYDLPIGYFPSQDSITLDDYLYFTIQHDVNDCFGKMVKLSLISNQWSYLNLNNLYRRSRLVYKDDQIVFVGGLRTKYKERTVEFHYTIVTKDLELLDAKLLSRVNFERNNIYDPNEKLRYVFYPLVQYSVPYEINNVHFIRFDQETGDLKDLEMPAKFQFPQCRDFSGNIWGIARYGSTSDLFLINEEGECLEKIRLKGLVQTLSVDHEKEEIWVASSYETLLSSYSSSFTTLIYQLKYIN